MHVLKPELLWIGKRCYRVNGVTIENSHEQQKHQQTKNEYIEDDLYDEDVEVEDEFEVIEVSPNRYKTTFHVPQAFYGSIIGAKGSTKKRIEGETRTEITIPKHGTAGDIRILGTKRESVCAARRRIEIIVINSRRNKCSTHFTCIRITNLAIKSNCITFKDEILKSGPTLGLQEEMFIEPDKLHITIGMMVLMDDNDRTRAAELLNECNQLIVRPIKNQHGILKFTIRGVEIMNDDPSSVQSLYGKVESDTLQRIADGIHKRFIDAGLAKREDDRATVKLHMTLINAKHAKDDQDDESRKIKSKFDARHILEKYAQCEFGSQEFTEISLAIRRSKDADGFYKCTANIQF